MKLLIKNFADLWIRLRLPVLITFACVSSFLVYQASLIKPDAGFDKFIPKSHPYMKTFFDYQETFSNGNPVLISVKSNSGSIYSKEYFDRLKEIANRFTTIEGVDKSTVESLYSATVRYIEITEDGLTGGTVVPAKFDASPGQIEKVKDNIEKANIIGRVVSLSEDATLIRGQLIRESDTQSVNMLQVAKDLEESVRELEKDGLVEIHIVGMPSVVGSIASGTQAVVVFFLIAIAIAFGALYWFSRSLKLSLIPLFAGLNAVIWSLGIVRSMGMGIDPLSILVPFLIFAVGVSHGIQMIGAYLSNEKDDDSKVIASNIIQRMFLPASVALISDCLGFVTLLTIDIGVVQELAISATVGVASVLIINLFVVPLALSFVKHQPRKRTQKSSAKLYFEKAGQISNEKPRKMVLIVATAIGVVCAWNMLNLKVGDLTQGIPELKPDSRYNLDTVAISNNYSIGLDIMSVIAVTRANGCAIFSVAQNIDRMAWRLQNLPGVRTVISSPTVSKIYSKVFNEGSLKWNALPMDQYSLLNSMTAGAGLSNGDCSAMQLLVFTEDRKAKTLDGILKAVKDEQKLNPHPLVSYKLASGNLGIQAASNETIEAQQSIIPLIIFSGIFLLCLLLFRSLKASLCVIVPLLLVTTITYAIMPIFQIGIKTNTLAVIALGIGIGVDYGIYIMSQVMASLRQGKMFKESYISALESSGKAVLLTAVTLASGVMTWLFSPLKFQADMGILLSTLFIFNALASVTVLPCLAAYLFRGENKQNNHLNEGGQKKTEANTEEYQPQNPRLAS